MVYHDLLLLFVFSWLRWRRLRVAGGRRRRITAAQSLDKAMIALRQESISHVTIAAAVHPLQGYPVQRRL